MTSAPSSPIAVPMPGGVEGWQRTLWTLVMIQGVMSLSFTIMSPIMPLMLPALGVRHPAAIDVWTGVLTAITPFIAAFVSPFWGRLADRRGRKLMLLRSSLAISICTLLLGFAGSVWVFLGLRILMGCFAGFAAAAIALVAGQVPENRLGYALGWLSTGQLVGSLGGPVIGGVIADLFHSNRAPFFATAALAAVGLLLAMALVHERFTPAPPRAKSEARTPLARLRALSMVGGAALMPLVVVLFFSQFGIRTVQPVVTLYVLKLTGPVANIATLSGLAFSVTGIADLIASPFLGKRSDRLGYRRVLLISLTGATLFSLPQAFAHNYATFVAERFGVGLFIGGILPTANALIGRLAPPARRGEVFGLTASATFLGNSIGPLTGGLVAAVFGLHWVFLVTAALLAATIPWVWLRVPEMVGRDEV